jgi:hypothetical protein
MFRSHVLILAVVVFSLTLSGCISAQSMVDPGFPKVTYDDVKKRPEPLRLNLAVEFQRNGEHQPKVDSTIQDHAERVLRASGVITPTTDGPDGDIRIVMNHIADKGTAVAKGIGTGLTFGLATSTVTDSYEMDVMVNAKGKTAQKRGIRHALHTTVGNAALPGSAWVQIEPSAVEVDRCLEVLHVPEAAGHALDLLNLAVEPLAHRVGHRMLVVGQDVIDVPADGLGCLADRL